MMRLCKQKYHGVVRALGCAGNVREAAGGGRVEGFAMNRLGNGLSGGGHYARRWFVKEARLSMMQRVGASEGQRALRSGHLR